ncbi:glycosyltransferase [Rhodococcus sp. ABRD24]|uniref:glycosyltransferase n=1 Tax=Rhodococcus sp. ABRD24 TaxID=2507582 RepID=UPI001F61CFF3|nr:glycosyltransferase [Rhodococcus sp. ABRD24]
MERYERLPEEFILGASRLVPYKRLDTVIDLGNRAGVPVVIAGGGPELNRLKSQAADAGVPVFFLEDPSDVLLYAVFQKASVYVFPPVEDFGIMPIESIALGTPVLVNTEGGASESVARLRGGLVVEDFSSVEAITKLHEAIEQDMTNARAQVDYYSAEQFATRLTSWMAPYLGSLRGDGALGHGDAPCR